MNIQKTFQRKSTPANTVYTKFGIFKENFHLVKTFSDVNEDEYYNYEKNMRTLLFTA